MPSSETPDGTPAPGFPEEPESPGHAPGDRSKDPTPHTSLNTPVGEADPTEYPDPYDQRDDPRDGPDGMAFPGDGTSHTQVGSRSTSDPVADDDVETDRGNALEGDDVDQ